MEPTCLLDFFTYLEKFGLFCDFRITKLKFKYLAAVLRIFKVQTVLQNSLLIFDQISDEIFGNILVGSHLLSIKQSEFQFGPHEILLSFKQVLINQTKNMLAIYLNCELQNISGHSQNSS